MWLARGDNLERACSLQVCPPVYSLLSYSLVTEAPFSPFSWGDTAEDIPPQLLGRVEVPEMSEHFCRATLNTKFLSKRCKSCRKAHGGRKEQPVSAQLIPNSVAMAVWSLG